MDLKVDLKRFGVDSGAHPRAALADPGRLAPERPARRHGQHDRQRGSAHSGQRVLHLHLGPAMGRHLHRLLRGAAAALRQHRRPDRTKRICRSSSVLFAAASCLASSNSIEQLIAALEPWGMAVALVTRERLAHRPLCSPTARRRPSPSASGRRVGPGHRARPGAGRSAAGAFRGGSIFMVNFGHRRRAPAGLVLIPSRRTCPPASVRRESAASRLSVAVIGLLRLRTIIEAPSWGWTEPGHPGGFVVPGAAGRLRPVGVPPRSTRCWTSASSAIPGLRGERGHLDAFFGLFGSSSSSTT